jgi:hypothetical protein
LTHLETSATTSFVQTLGRRGIRTGTAYILAASCYQKVPAD